MTPEARRQAIVAAVLADGALSIDDLAARFEISRMTVHRDLDLLAGQGLLRKERGMATAESTLVYETNFHYRVQIDAEDKRALCAAAAKLIGPGQVVMVDESTTTLPLVDALAALGLEDLTLVTNAVPLAERVQAHPGLRLITTGGLFDANQRAYYGLVCERALASLRADWAVLSASAIIGTALHHQDPEVLRVKRAFMDAAEHRALLVTANKFSIRALHRYADLSEFDHVLVHGALDGETAALLRGQGIQFEQVA